MTGDRSVGDGGLSPTPQQQHPDFDLILQRINELNGLVGLDGRSEVVVSSGSLGGAGSRARLERRKPIVVGFYKDGFRLDTQVTAAHERAR